MRTGPNRLAQKDKGAGIIISAFITREFGLLCEIDEHTLNFVNTNWFGAKYANEEAAIDVQRTAKKRFQTMRPHFLVFFDYGENKEVYWNNNHMLVQFEDAIDV